MTESSQQIYSYKPGDKIRIALYLSDPSGVADVRASFAERTDTAKQIYLIGHGRNQVHAEVILETEVTNSIAPGEYWCFQLTLTDGIGNKSVINTPTPGIEFRIEEVPGDHDGPEYMGWKYA